MVIILFFNIMVLNRNMSSIVLEFLGRFTVNSSQIKFDVLYYLF